MNPLSRLLVVSVAFASLCLGSLVGIAIVSPSDSLLQAFDSKSELVRFFSNSDDVRPVYFDSGFNRFTEGYSSDAALEAGTVPFSETNVQTEGVDEQDIVKTDGEYIYTTTSTNLSIVKATPPEQMHIVSMIAANDFMDLGEGRQGYINGLYVKDDWLVVIGGESRQYGYYVSADDNSHEQPGTVIYVFNISDKAKPTLERTVGISGSSLSSRMIGDTVYVMTRMTVRHPDESSIMPRVWSDDIREEVPLSSVRYDPETSCADSMINILALDILTGDHESISIVADWSCTIYMSTQSLYFAVKKWRGALIDDPGILGPRDGSRARTTVYKILTDGLRMEATASGEVRGWLLNQFSMDEHQGNLRVATTTSWDDIENAVYVLDDDLDLVGALEGLAPTERIYSARFVGETLYLVTFRQVDPLFVIDLSNPVRPKVVGELKIPGFSNYLHPVDDTHVLGLGREDVVLKVSLFDVSDPTSPAEQSKYLIEGCYYSPALYDHKAFLFDRERELLVIPSYQWSATSSNGSDYRYYCNPVAYVFKVSLADGISLRGVVSHDASENSWYGDMRRSLYIGECLYTLSDQALQANLLEDLSFVGKVILNEDSSG